MVILDKQKILYVNIPKVASCSLMHLCAAMARINVGNKTFLGSDVIKKNNIPSTKKQVNKLIRQYYSFVFVRNPYDRLVSCYENKIKKDRRVNNEIFTNGVFKPFLKYGFYAGMSFEEFGKKVCRIPDTKSDGHFRSQHTFIPKKLKWFNFIGKTENMNEGIVAIKKEFGLHDFELPHLLKSDRPKKYQKYYRGHGNLKRMVTVRYRKDLELFNYSFK